MAQRKEARIFVTIWDDPIFRAHSAGAQRMYLYLLSQIDLSYCGVIPLRERRWARDAKGLTVEQVTADLEALAKPFPEGFVEGFRQGVPEGDSRPLIVIDDDTGEVLVRSLIRHDGIWRQPNLLKSAQEAAGPIRSPRIKTALIEELNRLPLDESPSSQVKAIVASFIADLRKGLPSPPPNPSSKGSANPSTDPSAKGSLGDRGSNGGSTRDPLSPGTLSPSPDSPEEASPPSSEIGDADSDDAGPGADEPEPIRDDVERLCTHLADRIADNGSKRPTIGKKWRTAARLMLDRDGRTEQQIHRAIDWCQNDEFWRQNVMSMSKLREQYDRLRLAAKPRGPGGRPTNQHVESAAGDALAEVFG